MAKTRKIGGISFSAEGYEKFVSLSKEEQIEQVYNSLNPKDRVQAEELLSRIPNGDSSGVTAKDTWNKPARPSGGSPKGNNAQSQADKP